MRHLPFFDSYDPIRKQLTLRGASHLPEEVFEFEEQIEILDMSRGALESVPKDLHRLSRLRIAFFSQNPIVEIPESLGACTKLELVGFKSCQIQHVRENSLPDDLRWLILTDNQLQSLPRSMGRLHRLQKLALAANRLDSLPDEMCQCTKLQLLRLAANDFKKSPPSWIFDLPSLAWYGDAGNPFCEALAIADNLETLSPDEVEIGPQIGKSPSSTVFRGSLTRDGRGVAVKHYLGKFTSDGYARDDIRAAIGAGLHPHLIQVIAKFGAEGAEQASLVLGLIPPEFRSLGLPPSLNSCTRDEFPQELSFSLPFIFEALRSVSSAVEHLHQRGITHGDLYAHNILSNAEGRSILGDFGAASFFQPGAGSAREQVEVCAFGHLIDDLLLHVAADSDAGRIGELRVLHAACVNPVRSERPNMAEVARELRRR